MIAVFTIHQKGKYEQAEEQLKQIAQALENEEVKLIKIIDEDDIYVINTSQIVYFTESDVSIKIVTTKATFFIDLDSEYEGKTEYWFLCTSANFD